MDELIKLQAENQMLREINQKQYEFITVLKSKLQCAVLELGSVDEWKIIWQKELDMHKGEANALRSVLLTVKDKLPGKAVEFLTNRFVDESGGQGA